MKCPDCNCQVDVLNRYDMAYHMQTLHPIKCELCEDTGHVKSNTLELEGNCPNCEKKCFKCGHGEEHHDDGDACRFETCQCKCWE